MRRPAHTGRTDIPLTAAGELKAAKIGDKLSGQHFGLVLVSPLERAADLRDCGVWEGGADRSGLSRMELWGLWRDD
jgi:hypothetical protein